jgi:hypothetical protein
MTRAAAAMLFAIVLYLLAAAYAIGYDRGRTRCASPEPGTPVVWRGVVEGKA